MCGIAGFVGRGDPEDLRRMSAALAHRGPDAEGQWSISVDPPGTYLVTLDPASLPEGVTLRDADRGTLEGLVEAGLVDDVHFPRLKAAEKRGVVDITHSREDSLAHGFDAAVGQRRKGVNVVHLQRLPAVVPNDTAREGRARF